MLKPYNEAAYTGSVCTRMQWHRIVTEVPSLVMCRVPSIELSRPCRYFIPFRKFATQCLSQTGHRLKMSTRSMTARCVHLVYRLVSVTLADIMIETCATEAFLPGLVMVRTRYDLHSCLRYLELHGNANAGYAGNESKVLPTRTIAATLDIDCCSCLLRCKFLDDL